jgi:hypothetical protein
MQECVQPDMELCDAMPCNATRSVARHSPAVIVSQSPSKSMAFPSAALEPPASITTTCAGSLTHCHDTTECCPLNGCVTSVTVPSGPTARCGPPSGGPWPREATKATTRKMGGTLTQAAPQRKATARPPCVEPREHWPKMTLESLFGSQGSAHRGGYRTMCNAPE